MLHLERHHSGCGCSSAGPLSLSRGVRNYERSRPFQVGHLLLDLELDFELKSVRGSARLDLKRADSDARVLTLDAVDFDITRVELKTTGKPTRAVFRYDGKQLLVTIPARASNFSLTIHYSAEPRRGLYFLAPDRQVPGRPRQVYSQCQDEDARHWFPCHDKPHQKMTTELRVRVPAGMTVLSNGDLVSARTQAPKRAKSAKATWLYHFKLDQPHPSYLVTLVAGEFEVWREPLSLAGGREVELAYYVPPGKKADGERAFRHTASMLRLFSEKTGVPYPFSRYSQIVVSDFMFGGMENTTATTLEEETLLDAKAARDVDSNFLVSHEIAHQWFGNYVTCRDWSHAWLNEGFATFCELVDRESRLGRDEYDYALRRDLANYLAEAGRYRRAIVCRDYDAPIDLFDRHLYEKGCLVLHMLRRELGDARFWQGINRYLTEHAHGLVETNDLMRALEHVSGRSLERFFDAWVYRPGHPVLQIKVSYTDGALVVDVKQTQKGEHVAVFELPCEIELGLGVGKPKRHFRRLQAAQDSLVVKLPKAPEWVEIDPEFVLLGRVEIDCPLDMLEKQLERGPRARTRWVAAQLLGKKGGRRAIAALGKCLSNSGEAWMVRVEAANALGKLRDERALLALLPHAGAAEDRVRRAVLFGLGSFKDARVEAVLAKHARADASYLVQGEAARALGRSRSASARALLEKLLAEPAWGDSIRSGALSGLAALGDEAALAAVLESTEYGLPTRGRRAAVLALPEVSESRKVRRRLEELLDDPHPHVRSDVARALESLGAPEAQAALRSRLALEGDERVKRRLRIALEALASGAKSNERRLAREVESLREKLESFEARLGKFEQKKGKRK